MKKILLLVAIVLCLGVVAAQSAESTKELSTTQRDFVNEYNRAGGDLGFNFLPTINNSNVKRLDGSVKDAANVKLTEYSSIVITFQKGSKSISEAMFIGVGNNEKAGALITASGICVMRAFTSKEPLALEK